MHLETARLIIKDLDEYMAARKVMEKCGFILAYEGMDLYQGQERLICRYLFQGSSDR